MKGASMLNVNLKKLKAYGDRLDDGVLQLSFTLPVAASPEAKEAARLYIEQLGLEKASIATMESMGEGFTYFVAYGHAKHTLDFTKIRVPKVEIPQMDYAGLKEYMARHFEKPLVVIGAATGADAHTVGIDAIMNMKGFGGDYGLERYPLFKAINLRSQLTNEQLIDKAVELHADAILISQVVTQRDSHVKNLREFRELAKKDRRLPKETVIIIGGPRIEHALALKLGFDAGFGPGTRPSQVASFIVHDYMKRHGIKEKQAEVKVEVERKAVHHEPHHAPRHEVKPHAAAHHAPKLAAHPAVKPATHHAPKLATHPAVKPATHHAPKPAAHHAKAVVGPDEETLREEAAPRKKRRRGRRGGRRHRRRREQVPGTPTGTTE